MPDTPVIISPAAAWPFSGVETVTSVTAAIMIDPDPRRITGTAGQLRAYAVALVAGRTALFACS